MGFDFQSAINEAQAVVSKSSEGGGSTYKYPLIYPQAGASIVVRPLFNPKSGQIVRLIQRHEKVACYKTYGIECPICKTQQQIKDMTGQDPFGRTSASKSRGICFAQFVSATYPVKKGGDGGELLQPGELILFMFPWSVYSQINAIIQATAQTPTGMDQAFSHAQSGLFIQVTVTKDFKYTTVSVPYMASPVQQSDEDFIKMLNEIDSLADQVLPAQITEEISKQVQEYTDNLNRQYITPRVPNQAPYSPQVAGFNSVPSQPSGIGYQMGQSPSTGVFTTAGTGYAPIPGQPSTPSPSVPSVPQVPQMASPQTNTSVGTVPQQYAASPAPSDPQVPTQSQLPPGVVPKPACWGQHVENDPKCICCPYEVQCIDAYPF